jgi:protein gp37
MAETSHIEWTDATWNPITGCTMVSAGCTHCYAMGLAATRLRDHPSREGLTRMTGGRAVWTGEVRLNEQWLDQPLRWKRPRMIFVCAHGDLFHESVPDEWIDRVFAVMALAPQHTFQVLTKRPERARAYFYARLDGDPWAEAADYIADLRGMEDHAVVLEPSDMPLPNVWLGTSVEDQATADTRIPHLLATPAAVRFVSAEPLLGPVALDDLVIDDGKPGEWHVNALDAECGDPADDPDFGCNTIDWVIVGGESGPGARPMHPDWARSLRDQCQAAGVAFFFKQWGQWLHESQDRQGEWDWSDAEDRRLLHYWNDDPEMVTASIRLRKGDAGRLLDGRTWDQMPDLSARGDT